MDIKGHLVGKKKRHLVMFVSVKRLFLMKLMHLLREPNATQLPQPREGSFCKASPNERWVSQDEQPAPRINSIMGDSELDIRKWDWKQGATSWGGSLRDFIGEKIKPRRNSTDHNSAPAPGGWVGCPLVYLVRFSDTQRLHGNYICTRLVSIKSNYVPK